MSTAYVTHGTAYHLDPTCPRLVHGELLWDSDSDENWWIAGAFRREVSGPDYAAACGKWPCLHCVPADVRAFPPLYGQTFGHEPVDMWPIGTMCARCYVRTWPCTSALVLGLVPRATAGGDPR